jgi:hypothetical protein
MRVSTETIYQSLYVQSRGALRRDLHRCLRTGRALRVPDRQGAQRKNRVLPDMINISERPAEAADRAVPGHWEGDLIIGKANASAIGTLVERTSGYTMLVHLPNGYRAEQVAPARTGRFTAVVAAPNAASRSRHGEPSALGTGWSTPARWATCSRCSRIASKRAAATRSQPRTVAAGTPSLAPIGRCPAPVARAVSAAPITSSAYARRDSPVIGSSICVIRQSEHRARRGRSRPASP